MLITDGKLDLKIYQKDNRMVYIDSIQHKDARDVGSERLCYNTWQNEKQIKP